MTGTVLGPSVPSRGVPFPRRRRWRPALAAGLAAVAAVAAGCGGPGRSGAGAGGSPGPPAPAPTSPTTAQAPAAGRPLRWAACRGGQGPAGFECATLQVPLDPGDPAKGTIGLALDRHPATGRAVGTLVVNPGGPGVSGVDWLGLAWPALPLPIRQHFAVVSFDPPGVGRSDPVTCGTPRQLDAYLTSDLMPTAPAGWSALASLDRRFAAGCVARSGRILPYVGTIDAARDLDRIRAALGEAKLSYLGFSYGTLLGATYAQLFPRRVGTMVLDGAIDPAVGPLAMLAAQTRAIEAEFDAFAATCAAGRCGWRPASTAAGVVAAYERLLARTARRPLAAPRSGQVVDRTVLLYATVAGLYVPAAGWGALGQAIAAAARGDGRPALAMFDSYVGRYAGGGYANTIEAETAVDCEDAPAPSLAAIEAAAPAVARQAPVFGLADLESEVQCTTWPVPATRRVGPIRAPGSPPIVVVGSTHDPVTPYAWARSLAGELAHGVLVTRDGYGHTGYFASRCVQQVVDAYLLSGRPPPAATTCRA